MLRFHQEIVCNEFRKCSININNNYINIKCIYCLHTLADCYQANWDVKG